MEKIMTIQKLAFNMFFHAPRSILIGCGYIWGNMNKTRRLEKKNIQQIKLVFFI
jgi:hypothetical protein